MPGGFYESKMLGTAQRLPLRIYWSIDLNLQTVPWAILGTREKAETPLCKAVTVEPSRICKQAHHYCDFGS